MEGLINRETMGILSGVSRLVRPVRGEALIEAEDPTMVAEADMGKAAKANTSAI